MILKKISILNYKNIREASLELSPKINCFIGHNGEGKTNLLDAVYYLSFCHSAYTSIDSQVICHDQDFFVLEGEYLEEERKEERGERIEERLRVGEQCSGMREERREGATTNSLTVSCAMKRGTKKHFKRNKKEYKRLSEHIGLIPLIFVSPSDTFLIEGGSEERRRLMDVVISQYDHTYIDTLNNYNKALQQRNTLLKMEEEPDLELLKIWEEQMALHGEQIYKKRDAFVKELIPVFQEIYAVGYSLHGIHRDDLEMLLGGYPIKREGSQGQHKTFVIALKLAQFSFLKRTASNTTPLLLLDDIFDKLDARRVEQIVRLVSSEEYGQIFITDTNRDHLDQILSAGQFDYKLFNVENGEIMGL